jgi:hypothetical protein
MNLSPRRIGKLALSRRGWRELRRRVSQGLPLPTNEPGVLGRIESLDEAGVRVLRKPVPAPDADGGHAPQTLGPPHKNFAGRVLSPPRPLRAGVLPGWRLETRFGLVLDPSRRVLAESSWGEEQLLVSRILSSRRLPRPRRLAGTYATLISQWCDHYYHWLADGVPRFLVLEELGFGRLPVLLPREAPAYQRESLVLLGANPEQPVEADADLVEPHTLVWPAFAGPSGHPPAWACRRIGERLRAAVGARDGRGRRIYISRSRAAHRRVLNEDELLSALEPFEFEVVAAETMPFAEQVRTFAAAELVVAPHGAGLANLLFSCDATALEIHEPDYVNPCFYSLIAAAGHRYWYALGERFGPHRVPPPYRDLRVPVPLVAETIARILT